MTLKELVLCFPAELHAAVFGDGMRDVPFTAIRFWDKELCGDCLYIAQAGDLGECPDQDGLPPLIVIENCPYSESWKTRYSGGILTLSGQVSPMQVYNILENSVFSAPKAMLKIPSVIEAMTSGSSGNLIQRISELIDAPVAMLDSDLRPLAVSEFDELTYRRFSVALKKGYYYDIGIKPHLFYNKISAKAPGSSMITSLKDCDSAQIELFCPIKADSGHSVVTGYLYAFFLQKEDALRSTPLLNYLSKLLIREFWPDRIPRIPGTESNILYVVRRILDTSLSDNLAIEALLKGMGFSCKNNLCVVTIIPSDSWDRSPMHRTSTGYLINIFSELFESSVVCMYNSTMMILLQSNELPVLPEAKKRQMNRLLLEHQCFAGISDTFHCLDNSLKYYYERSISAALAVAALPTDLRYAEYAQVSLRHIIHNLVSVSNGTGLSGILHYLVDPNLIRLVERDALHNTNYVKMLRCYWGLNRNISAICSCLHIHRSTLFYRLNKISEILQQDINDYNNILQLSVGFALLEAFRIIPPEQFVAQSPEEDTPE